MEDLKKATPYLIAALVFFALAWCVIGKNNTAATLFGASLAFGGVMSLSAMLPAVFGD